MTEKAVVEPAYSLPRMKSVERISKLPAVEQTVDLANNIYGRMKDTNNLVRAVLKTAESTVKGAVDMTLPVTAKLQGPIRVMDSFLCSSLDYVETKIPAVKLPLDEMYKNTRDSLYTIPGVKCACQAGEHGVKKAVEIAYGASQYGTQKLKDVKQILTEPPQNPDDGKKSFAVQYSLAAKRLISLLLSWLWISKPHFPDRRPLTSAGENALNDKKESEAHKGLNSSGINSGVSFGKPSVTSGMKGTSNKWNQPSCNPMVPLPRGGEHQEKLLWRFLDTPQELDICALYDKFLFASVADLFGLGQSLVSQVRKKKITLPTTPKASNISGVG